MFNKICIIGIGMIGGSVALAARAAGVRYIAAMDANAEHVAYAHQRGMIDNVQHDNVAVLDGADLIVLAVPVRSYEKVFAHIAPHVRAGVIVTDVGSTKRGVMAAAEKFLPGVTFIGGHPIAGLEKHGPQHADAGLFQNRWTVLTPAFAGAGSAEKTDGDATRKLFDFWQALGAHVEIMTPHHHDRVLAITSHLPQLIARAIVGTAADLEDELQDEVIKFSAGGFRDFTRMAAADPVMWRDIFLENSDAVLEMLQRLSEDIALMQKRIRAGDADALETVFARARNIRQRVIEARQA